MMTSPVRPNPLSQTGCSGSQRRDVGFESFLTFSPDTNASSLNDSLGDSQPVCAELYGTRRQIADMESALSETGLEVPRLKVLSTSPVCAGLQIHAIEGVTSKPLFLDGRLCGFCFESPFAKYCLLSGLLPADLSAPAPMQAQSLFQKMAMLLEGENLTFADVARTWFYNDDILSWYDDFNRVRTSFFKSQRITRIPASTGIGAPNPEGAALAAKALAIRPLTPEASLHPLVSPRQCEASDYGSVFSRAMEFRAGTTRTLTVSGTASIAPGGQTIHIGDPSRQIETTMQVVETLLASAGMSLADATRVVTYFRNPEHRQIWETHRKNHDLPDMPLAMLACIVCRDDLLFEIELDTAVDDAADRP